MARHDPGLPVDWPFMARALDGGPGNSPGILLKVALAPGAPGGKCPMMSWRLPLRQAVRMHAQLGAAIEQTRRQGVAVEDGPAEA